MKVINKNGKEINFESAYELMDEVDDYATPCTATNENGESIIIDRIFDIDNGYYYRVTTAQKNGWCRINEYYADGTISETYDK